MSNGGPHGDKFNKFPINPQTSSDVILDILNQTPDGKYATSAFEAQCGDGLFLFVGYYGAGGNQQ